VTSRLNGRYRLQNLWLPEAWCGALLFCVLAPVLGLRMLPYLMRIPESAAEKCLGAVSLGILTTALLADFVYRVVSFFTGGGFLIGLIISNVVVFITQMSLARCRPKIPTATSDLRHWNLRTNTTTTRIALAVFASIGIISFFSPVLGNDQYEYFAVANQWSINGVHGYPPVTGSLEGAVVAPSSHPTAYHTFIAALGLSGMPILFHLIFNTVVAASILYIAGFARQPGFYILIFCGTPIFISQLVSKSIDPVWISGLQLGVLSIFIQCRNVRSLGLTTTHFLLSLCSLAVAMALVVGFHSTGLIGLVLLSASLLIVLRPSVQMLGAMFCSGLLALLISNQYLVNLRRYGSPVQDSAPVFDLPALEFATDLVIRRGLITTWDKLFNGALRGFTDYFAFGLVAWIALVSLVVLIYSSRKVHHQQFVYLQAVLFICLLLFFVSSATLGVDLVIKNARYWQLFLPSMAALAGSVAWRE